MSIEISMRSSKARWALPIGLLLLVTCKPVPPPAPPPTPPLVIPPPPCVELPPVDPHRDVVLACHQMRILGCKEGEISCERNLSYIVWTGISKVTTECIASARDASKIQDECHMKCTPF
jgi:hypothetical protein